jgi:D-xylose transport system permease protein
VTQTPIPVAETSTAPTDLQDERLIRPTGVRENFAAQVKRIRTGDLGALPVVVGLLIICVIFTLINPVFLSADDIGTIVLLYCAPYGVMAVGIVLVLLLGQIDLSVGSMSGVAASIFAVIYTKNILPEWAVIIVALAAGVVVGFIYAFLFIRFSVPSFVVTLAGLLALLGAQLAILGPVGDYNIPATSFMVQLGQAWYLPPAISYALVVICAGGYFLSGLMRSRARSKAGLSTPGLTGLLVRAIVLLVLLALVVTYLDSYPIGGVSTAFAFLVLLVIIMNYALTRTKWGRDVFAVGGNVEAARRAGIRVNRIYVSVFVLCAFLAALGGLMAMGLGASTTQSSGTGNVNLNAIAAAVIGGTSLFGGRGSAWSALLGILVIESIQAGLNLMQLNSDWQFIVTGLVLLIAVVVDSLSRRSRVAAGRA